MKINTNPDSSESDFFLKMLEDGETHFFTSIETPLREDAFEISDNKKIELISDKFKEILEIMGLDLRDDSLIGTPHRVAKMFVSELFYGLDPKNKPKISLFDNKYKYNDMLIEKNIRIQSTCEHHFLPIEGICHIAYIPNGKVIGISKLNRIVDYFSKRPQVQERLTIQISNELKNILDTEDVAVYIEARHLCVSSRGIKDINSSTVTSDLSGKFSQTNFKEQFFSSI